MKDLDYDGKMTFRTHLPYKNIKKHTHEKYYYKVYHNGFPLKVEKRRISNDSLVKTYFFNHTKMIKTIEHKAGHKIECKYNYSDNKKLQICDNNMKIVTILNNKDWQEKLQYKDNKLIQKKVRKHGKIYVYDSKNRVVEKFNDTTEYYDLPVKLPGDSYPWGT